MLWFTPPPHISIKSCDNVLKFVKHFIKLPDLKERLFNKDSLKPSYDNMENIMINHNRKILERHNNKEAWRCNFGVK